MSEKIPDLWPDDFGKIDQTPPSVILREQAELLTKKTRGLVEGRVHTSKNAGSFIHQFVLLAPSLDDYSYSLFAVYHPVEFYPLHIRADVLGEGKGFSNISSEAEFLKALREILADTKTARVIRAMLAQAQAITA